MSHACPAPIGVVRVYENGFQLSLKAVMLQLIVEHPTHAQRSVSVASLPLVQLEQRIFSEVSDITRQDPVVGSTEVLVAKNFTFQRL